MYGARIVSVTTAASRIAPTIARYTSAPLGPFLRIKRAIAPEIDFNEFRLHFAAPLVSNARIKVGIDHVDSDADCRHEYCKKHYGTFDGRKVSIAYSLN